MHGGAGIISEGKRPKDDELTLRALPTEEENEMTKYYLTIARYFLSTTVLTGFTAFN